MNDIILGIFFGITIGSLIFISIKLIDCSFTLDSIRSEQYFKNHEQRRYNLKNKDLRPVNADVAIKAINNALKESASKSMTTDELAEMLKEVFTTDESIIRGSQDES